MDKKIIMIIGVGSIIMIIVAFGVVSFIIKPKTEQMLSTPVLSEDMTDMGADLFAEEEDQIPFTERFTIIPVERLTANPLGSPENYLQVTIAIIVNNDKLAAELDSDVAKNLIKAILLKKLSSKRIEDVDTPEKKEELRKEIDKDIRRMITSHMGAEIWDKKGYRMEIEFVDFLIA